jgi:hypothetical protein
MSENGTMAKVGVVRMTATELVFKSELLVTELAAELIRDRHKYTEEVAEQRARHVLGRVCRHCNWPQGVYLYDQSEDQEASE